MKKSATIRLIIYSLITIILTAILVLGIVFNSIKIFGFSINVDSYDDSEYNVYSEKLSYNKEQINSFDIDWTAGNVTIKRNSSDKIEIFELSTKKLDKKDKLRYYVDEKGTLKIKYRQSNSFFGLIFNSYKKNLELSIPDKTFNKLSLDSQSADVSITNAKFNNIDAELVSGTLNLNAVNATSIECDTISGSFFAKSTVTDKLSIDSTSAKANFAGSITSEMDVDTTSGTIILSSDTCPQKIEVDAISADVNINIPETSEFTCSLDSVSGDFQSNFATIYQNKKYICGKGTSIFEIDSVSGDVTVNKNFK